jgi:hypothetical protein
MRFKRAVQRYGRTPEPETPYQRAGQVWDERIGSARVQARSWRLIAFGCLAISASLSGGLLWQSLQSRVVPYVVEVDRLGEARAVRPAERTYEPTDPQIAWHLGQFIRDVRSVSLDPVLMRESWLSAYDFVTDRGARFLGSGDQRRARVGPLVPGQMGRKRLRARQPCRRLSLDRDSLGRDEAASLGRDFAQESARALRRRDRLVEGARAAASGRRGTACSVQRGDPRGLAARCKPGRPGGDAPA